ncbi:hypothetical protein GCM10018785_49500 [Streptomyces longispororuber]|uniref:Lipoprotein n=1 Tax=Streptomyces longispororuber TaxID=68230 RepID=A0A919DT93_9ACTN|nr:hypothetical protein [Streptomyces longispororuber]GHE75220.1 hypothetical protein GCM10018785_49500 [Streptomyces longispororuber]
MRSTSMRRPRGHRVSPRSGRRAWAACAPLVLALLSGCTSGSGGAADKADGPGRAPRSTPTTAAPDRDEAELGRRVREALGTESIDDRDPLFVEAGVERVGDGIHARPELAPGAVYEVVVACAGKGRISLSIGGERTRRGVRCDGVATARRTPGSRETVEIDAAGEPGAVGMVGWRVSKVGEQAESP